LSVSCSPPLADPEDTVWRARHAFDVLADGDGPIAVAVSGGSDSTALLRISLDWARLRRRTIIAATVDHGLRVEAAAEAKAVARLCASLGVAHETLTWRPDGPASQAHARGARHALLARWAKSLGARMLALGHTADDRMETLLLRARAGSHWYGLASPLPWSPSPVFPEGDGLAVLRPLLGVRRSALRACLSAWGQDWIEDPSNLSQGSERVRVRARLANLPPEAQASLLRSGDGLARLRAAVHLEARAAADSATPLADSGIAVAAEALERLSAEARVRLIEALLMGRGRSSRPPRHASLQALVAALGPAAPPFRGRTLGHVHIRRTGGEVTFSPAPPRRGQGSHPVHLSVERARALLADPRLEALIPRIPPCDGGADMRSFVTCT
jgi:tRNA(Ile)-lysidine synthase